MKRLPILLLFICFAYNSFGQYTSINLPYPSDVCAGNDYVVSVYSVGISTGTALTIQLSNDDFNSNVIVIGSGNYTGNYPESITCNIPSNTAAGTYKIRATFISTPTGTFYNSSSFSVVKGTPGASLTGTFGFDACGSGVNVPITFTGSGPFTFSYKKDSESPLTQTAYTLPYNLYLSQAGTYTLLSVSNACGTGTVSPTQNNATVNITPPILTIGTPSDDNICIGNKIYVPFTSNQNCYGYTVQISDENGENFRNLPTETNYSFPNRLTATITDVGQPTASGYKLRIKVYANSVEYFSPVSTTTITLRQKSSYNVTVVDAVDYYNPNQIAKGENVKIRVTLTGTAPWILNFDNSALKITNNTYDLQVSPVSSKKYTFGPLVDGNGCVNSFEQSVDISVKDLIFKMRIQDNKNLDIYSHFRNYCKDEYLHVDYNVRGQMPEDSFKIQMANVNDLQNNIEDWQDVVFFRTGNDEILDVEIPAWVKTGKNRIRFVPKNTSLSYANTTVDYINDSFTPSSDFIVMNRSTGSITGESTIKISPNESFYIPYKFSGGPDFYANNFGSLKPYKPILVTDKGQTIDYNSLLIGGFNALTGITKVDTVTKNIKFYLYKVDANTAASGDLSCSERGFSHALDSLSVIVVPNDQTRSITVGNISGLNNLCGGSLVTIPFTTTGSFTAGTVYQVQLQEYNNSYSTNPNTNFFDVPTQAYTTPNQLTFTMPKSLGAYQDIYYKVRIVASNPNVIGTSAQWLVVTKQPPYIELSGDSYIQPGETGVIKIKAGYYPSFNFNISGGGWTSPSLSSYSYSTSYFQDYTVSINSGGIAGAQIDYLPINASNSCGNGEFVGRGRLNVVATPKIVLGTPTPSNTCQPTKILIPFTTNLSFENDNAFSAKVWHTYYGYEYIVPNVTVKKLSNSFEVSIPYQNLATTYNIKVFSKNPYATSNTANVFLKTSPYAYSSPSDVEVEYGDAVTLNYNIYDGTSPFNFTLDQGDKSLNILGSNSTYNHTITPQYSKNYYLTNLFDANNCQSVAAAPYQQVTVIEKKQAIEINRLSVSHLCSNANVNVYFLSSGTFTNFTLQLSDANGANFADISTTQSGNTLIGTIPNALPAGNNYRIRIKGITSGSPIFSLANNIGLTSVSGSLTATISGNQAIIKDQNSLYFTEQVATLKVDFTGIGPYKFNLYDGTNTTTIITHSNPYYFQVKPSNTTTYTLQNLSNDCGNGNVSGSATVNVVFLETGNASARICYGQTITVPFTQTGTFGPSTNYFIDLYYVIPYNNTRAFTSNIYSLPATVVGNTLQATIPNTLPVATGYEGYPNVSVYWVRVRTNNPKVIGTWSTNGGTSIGEGAPTVKILGSTNILSGQVATLTLQTDKLAGGISVVLNNGSSNETINFSGLSIPIEKYPITTTTYTVLNVANGCNISSTIGSPNSATVTVGACPPSQIVTITHTSGQVKKYETSGALTAINTIQSGANITYDSQKVILLNPGFQVNNNANFKAQIDGCGNF
ncbi:MULTISPECIES: 3-coathanger stack domain-containing protein [Emticicia]|uniref:3-coathanger stack domain-containing protein n=1 Tax=Emticicia TaxID=312278 RepID=UPI0007D8A445|nr:MULTISPECIES: 3-coathanger stack domain-containing protein [Emticicia]